MAAGAGAAVAGVAPAALGRTAPNETIRVGIVGPGRRGQMLLDECIQFGKRYNARLTAVCDAWSIRRDQAARRTKDGQGDQPKVYKHLDDMLADDDIDAIIIGTADHQHGKMLTQCVNADRDVYCEKPMANVMEDANEALLATRKSGRIVQNGTQRRSWPKYRSALKLMKQGLLGDIVKVDINGNACSPYRWARPTEFVASAKEKDIDWKAFLMGKTDRPFDPKIYCCFRLFKEFSSGIIDQWMSHAIDAVHMLTGASYPRSAVTHGGIYKYHDYRENPDTIQVSFEYGEGEKKFLVSYAVNLINASGRQNLIMGTRGTLEYEQGWRLHGNDVKFPDRIGETTEIVDDPTAMHQMANWLDCVRRRSKDDLYCDENAGYGHSVACAMAAEAYWSGRRVEFDPKTGSLSHANG